MSISSFGQASTNYKRYHGDGIDDVLQYTPRQHKSNIWHSAENHISNWWRLSDRIRAKRLFQMPITG